VQRRCSVRVGGNSCCRPRAFLIPLHAGHAHSQGHAIGGAKGDPQQATRTNGTFISGDDAEMARRELRRRDERERTRGTLTGTVLRLGQHKTPGLSRRSTGYAAVGVDMHWDERRGATEGGHSGGWSTRDARDATMCEDGSCGASRPGRRTGGSWLTSGQGGDATGMEREGYAVARRRRKYAAQVHKCGGTMLPPL